MEKKFLKALMLVEIIRVITGCIEAPLQLTFQAYLVIKGVIRTDVSLVITDHVGNELNLSVTVIVSMVLSITSILVPVFKTNTFIEENSADDDDVEPLWKKSLKAFLYYFDYAPFLVTATLFKIGSLIMLTTILNIFVAAPIFLTIIGNTVFNQFNIKGNTTSNIPKWLMVFMTLSVPTCFSLGKPSQNLQKIKAKTLFNQTLISFIIYGISLVVLLCLVNFIDSFKLDRNLILSTPTINFYSIITIVMGGLSLTYSWNGKIRTSDIKGKKLGNMSGEFVTNILKTLEIASLIFILLTLMVVPRLGKFETRNGE